MCFVLVTWGQDVVVGLYQYLRARMLYARFVSVSWGQDVVIRVLYQYPGARML